MSCRLGTVASLRRKEITWPVKKCHRNRRLRRRVLSAERKWPLFVSHLFCSVGNLRTSRLLARSAVMRKNSGLSAGDNPPLRAGRSAVSQRACRTFCNWPAVDTDRFPHPPNPFCLGCCNAHSASEMGQERPIFDGRTMSASAGSGHSFNHFGDRALPTHVQSQLRSLSLRCWPTGDSISQVRPP
jgi:hypothetical protein